MSDPFPGILAVPDEKNAHYFHVVVYGPSYSLMSTVPLQYTIGPIYDRIYHPNIAMIFYKEMESSITDTHSLVINTSIAQYPLF